MAMCDDQVIPVCTVTGRDPTLPPNDLPVYVFHYFIPSVLILSAGSLHTNIWMF